MPDINNDDLDNLFRDAAEKYPLRTDSSDWEKVARELDEDENDTSLITPPVSTDEEKNKRRKILLLLLLLPMMGIGYYYWNNHSSSSIKNIAGTVVNNNKNSVAQKTGNADERGINKEADNKTSQKNAVNRSIDINNSADKKFFRKKPVIKEGSQNENSTEKVSAAGNGANVKSSKNRRTNSANNNSSSNNKHKKGKSVFENNFENNYSSATENKNLLNTGINNNVMSNDDQKRVSGFYIISLSDKNISSPDINNKKLNSSVASFIKPDSNSVFNKKNDAKDKNKKQSFFYTGLEIAPDLSMVKFQSIKGTGYTAGVLLGYNVSRKIAVETGVYYDYKKYYSEGEYFHNKSIDFLNYVNLLNVNGDCRMIEVPINFRYNIYANKKNTWFATTGLSTYFMFRDAYTYDYLYNGVQGEKYYPYNNSSQNWFSVLNFSAGYEHNIGKIGNLRLEPYLRIPLAGMGTGSLPIMSVGLNMVITHPFK